MSDPSAEIWNLIARAREVPAAERDAFLARECVDRPELLAEVRAILTLVDQNREFFEAATRVPSQALESSAGPGGYIDELVTGIDDLIDGHGFDFEAARCAERRDNGEYWMGPYQLVKLLGSGGFGAVFLALRREPVQFYVAIKVIQAGRASPAVLARFEQEREIIASLDHPGIARVIDAGTSPRGVPFVAIEYVPGEPLTSYCDRHQLTLEQRLDLFREVCDAVQHAHQRGVIHRDLKPGNILVREAAGPALAAAAGPGQPAAPRKPIVKIIDWGIAKAVQPLRSTPSVKTEGQFAPMTLQYASPEQAGAGGISPRDLDVRTDVFSLGVILYELLTGTRPISETDLRMAAQFEQLRLIREAERPRASTKLSEFDRLTPAEEHYIRQEAERTGQAVEQAREEYLSRKRGEAERIARERQLGLDRLRQRLRGDLDSILRKSLELDRSRRYDSPLSLASDIAAFLRGDAVPAHDAGTWYRLSKFVRRNRAAVAAVGAVMLAIVVGGAVATWQWRVAVAERDGTDRLLSFVNESVVSVADGSGPARLPISLAKVEALRAELSQRFRNKPELLRRMTETFARAYLAAGEPRSCSELIEQSLQNREATLLPAGVAEVLATAYFRQRRGPEAVRILEPFVRQARAIGEDQERSFDLRDRFAGALKWARRYGEARHEWLALRRDVAGAATPSSRRLLQISYDLLLLERARLVWLRDRRKLSQDSYMTKMVALTDAMHELQSEASTLNPEDEYTMMCTAELAALHAAIGERDEAIRILQRLLPQMDEVLGVRHMRTVEARAKLGRYLSTEGDPEGGVRELAVAVRGYRASLGPQSRETLTAGLWLAEALAGAGRIDDAIMELRSSMAAADRAGIDLDAAAGFARSAAQLCEKWGRGAAAAAWRDREAKPPKVKGSE